MTQFLRDEGSDSEEVLTPLMLDGTYLSRNFATLGPFLTLQPPCLAPSIGSQVRSFSCRSLPYHSLSLPSLVTSPSGLCTGLLRHPPSSCRRTRPPAERREERTTRRPDGPRTTGRERRRDRARSRYGLVHFTFTVPLPLPSVHRSPRSLAPFSRTRRGKGTK